MAIIAGYKEVHIFYPLHVDTLTYLERFCEYTTFISKKQSSQNAYFKGKALREFNDLHQQEQNRIFVLVQ